jgi:hypothetical protein
MTMAARPPERGYAKVQGVRNAFIILVRFHETLGALRIGWRSI